ncbi:MAG: acetate--CoA ligase family protein [Syntrophobacterales bacterium]|nr:acetate--CoA ligase family protein [Syntrophobacterales bacterium]
MKVKNNLDALFKPGSVALIGASATPGKLGYDILYNLIHAGFEGPIYPINPKADELLGLKAYPDIGATPTPADLAVIVIPAKMVTGTIDRCGKSGVRAAVVITGGFAEAGEEGDLLQQELAKVARSHGIRVVGPNCQGINYPHHNLCASWPLLTNRGGMAFISQSGTVGAALMDWASEENLGVSVFVSLGNRADVDEADCIRYFDKDPHTKVIAIYMEGVKRPQYFLESLATAKKPIVILKAGRTARGRIAAESHTKSLAGSDEIYNAIFSKYRVHRADNLEELYDYSKALAYMKKPKGRRLLNISSSGGAAILAIDEAEKLGFTNPAPSKELKARLRTFLPAHCGVSNPIDLTGDAITDPSLYSKVIAEAKRDFDTSVVIFGDPIHGAADIVTGEGELIVFCGGAEVEREEAKRMHARGIPVYPTPERAIRALYQLVRFDPPPAGKKTKTPASTSMPPRLLTPQESISLINRFRIPTVATYFAASAREAVALARELSCPVAMKISSPDIAHKTDVGGVKLNLHGAGEVRQAYEEIIAGTQKVVPAARIEGVTVSPMAEPGGLEVIIGVIRDPQYGHALMFGLGGIFTEIYRDVQFCLLPADDREFLKMIRSIKGYPLLAGVRGQKARDEKALVAIMKSLSRLVRKNPGIEQIDLNPVLVYEKGAVAVDFRLYGTI